MYLLYFLSLHCWHLAEFQIFVDSYWQILLYNFVSLAVLVFSSKNMLAMD